MMNNRTLLWLGIYGVFSHHPMNSSAESRSTGKNNTDDMANQSIVAILLGKLPFTKFPSVIRGGRG